MPRYQITDSSTGRTLLIEGDSPPTEQEAAGLFESAPPAKSTPADTRSPSIARLGLGLGTEVATGIASQTAGAALAPVTFGISYPVLAFSGGVGGSIAAQKIEGKDSISWGRALFSGLVNLIPGGNAAKGAGKAAVTAGEYIGREAIKGAALSEGDLLATTIIDEKRLPTAKEIAGYGATGAAFGGALGGAIRGGAPIVKKLLGKTEGEVDAMVAKGEISPVDLTPKAPPELANVPSPANATRRAVENIAEAESAAADGLPAKTIITAPRSELFLKANEFAKQLGASIAPSKVVGREVSDRVLEMRNTVESLDELASKIGKRVDDAIKASPNPAEAESVVKGFMNGTVQGPLPEHLAGIESHLTIAREKIYDLQTQLLNQMEIGMSKGDEQIADVIARSRNRSDYLTREYRFFTDANYRPTQESRDAAMRTLQAGYVESGMALEEAKAKAHDVLASLDAKKLSEVRSNKVYPTAIDGFLKEKQDISPELRTYLGEITQPGEQLRGTISRLGRAVERDAADAAIGAQLAKAGLATPEMRQGMVELNLRRNVPGGTGMYVEPQVQRALDILYLDNGEQASANAVKNVARDVWESAVSVSKATKVLLNPPSYAVQAYGNAATLMAMGINPLKGAPQGLRLTLGDYGPFEKLLARTPEARTRLLLDVNEMTKYGIKGANIIDSDLRAGLENGPIGAFIGKTIKPLGNIYTVPDTLGRFVGWKAIQRASKKIFPEAGDETIKKWAANEIGNTYQNYDHLSSSLKFLSRVGALKQFASFTMELARNQYNQGKTIKDMLAGTYGARFASELGAPDKAAMRAEGLKRLAGMAVVYGGTYAGIKGWNHAHGVDEEKYKAINESVVPEWDQKRLLAMSLSKDGRTLKYANPSYIVPQATALSMFEAGLSGAPIGDLANILSNEIFGEGTFVGKSAYGALANTDPDRREKISLETDDFKRNKELLGWFVTKTFEPGATRELDKLNQAIRGQGNLTPTDVGLRQLGARINDQDVQKAIQFRIKGLVENAKGAKAQYESERLKNRMSPQGLEDVYQNANRVRADALKEISKHVGNMKVLGFDTGETIATMKDAGLGTADILNMLDGTTEPFPRNPRITATDLWDDEISKLARGEQDTRIRAIAQNDIMMARSLIAKQKATMKAEARGFEPVDALVANLGVADGTRAAYIVKKMKASQAPESVLQEYIRKGLVTQDVMRDIRALRGD